METVKCLHGRKKREKGREQRKEGRTAIVMAIIKAKQRQDSRENGNKKETYLASGRFS